MKLLTKIVMIAAILSGTVSFQSERNGDVLTVETTVSNPEAIMDTVSEFVSHAARIVDDTINRSDEKQAATEDSPAGTGLFRIRCSWEDVSSQVGAYQNCQNAISACPKGYSVYDENGFLLFAAE